MQVAIFFYHLLLTTDIVPPRDYEADTEKGSGSERPWFLVVKTLAGHTLGHAGDGLSARTYTHLYISG